MAIINFLKNHRRIVVILVVCFVALSLLHGNALAAGTDPGSGSGGAGAIANFLGIPTPWELLMFLVAGAVNIVLSLASWMVVVSGALLNTSINLTLHIKDFVASSPAIFTIWQTIRDLSNIALIFLLLFAAIKMILGYESNLGKLIQSIVVVGILINFSFFITSVMIDASNVVSQSIYSAMLPAQVNQGIGIQNALSPEGNKLADVFMNSLKIQSLLKNGSELSAAGKAFDNSSTANKVLGAPIKMILIMVTGIIIMFMVSVSFTLAAAAFIFRLIILLFLLAFSPLWIASYAIPQLKSQSKEWWDTFKAQLIFMPVYLLLMYAALRILTESSVFKNGFTGQIFDGTSNLSVGWANDFIALAINFALVIFVINLPLVISMGMAGKAGELIDVKKWGGKSIWKSVGSFAGRNTVGRYATKVEGELANTKAGNSYAGRQLRSITTGSLAKSKFGGSTTYKDVLDIKKDVKKKGVEIDKRNAVNDLIRAGVADPARYSAVLDNMTTSQKLALGADTLANKNVLRHLKVSEFDAISKDTEKFSEEEQNKIKAARIEALRDSIAAVPPQTDIVKKMVGNMNAKDLVALGGDIVKPEIVAHLTGGQIKDLQDMLDLPSRQNIGAQIQALGAQSKAFGYIRKNIDSWQ